MIMLSFKLVTEDEGGTSLAKNEYLYKLSEKLDTQYLKGVRLDL